jgi:aldose 1-epimerase
MKNVKKGGLRSSRVPHAGGGAALKSGAVVGGGGGGTSSYYEQFYGLALEAQHFPDSAHHQSDPAWPTVVLRAGETYRQRTGYRLWIEGS